MRNKTQTAVINMAIKRMLNKVHLLDVIFVSLHFFLYAKNFFLASVIVIVNKLLILNLNLVVSSIPNGHF